LIVLVLFAVSMRSKRSSGAKVQKAAESEGAESERHGGTKRRK